MTFDPHRLTPTASLNRVRIVNLPGLDIDPEVRGKTGYELVSTQYLIAQILKSAEQLKLTSEELTGERSAIPMVLNRCLNSDDIEVRAAAQGIARRLGRNIAYLLLTLKRGDLVNRQARPDWDESYWEYWANIKQVWLGGGLLSGELGRHLLQYIQQVFSDAQTEGYKVNIDPHGASLPMVGASRYAPRGALGALILDFGSSSVKRACAVYQDDTVMNLLRLPSIPAPRDPGADEEASAVDVFDTMIGIFLASWRYLIVQHGVTPARVILASIASYIDCGQIADRQGGKYTLLRQMTDNAERTFTSVLSAQLHAPIEVVLLHDGTAAAAAYADEPDAAVVTIGTALGVGFPPPADQLRGMRRPVKISDFELNETVQS